jgi:hypothetical protein
MLLTLSIPDTDRAFIAQLIAERGYTLVDGQSNTPTTDELLAHALSGKASIEAGKGISIEELEAYLDTEPTEQELAQYARKA